VHFLPAITCTRTDNKKTTAKNLNKIKPKIDYIEHTVTHTWKYTPSEQEMD